ncbi:MAG: outer membrane protein assembly factor BamA, partial [Mariprofundaceae bacterium]
MPRPIETLFRSLVIAVIFSFSVILPAWGEDTAVPVIDVIASIDVVGNKAVEAGVILERIRIRVGDKLDRKRISQDVRSLFATGFFKDVRVLGVVKADGRHLTVEVDENPVIASMNFDGLNAVAEKDMVRRLKLKSGHILNSPELKKDIITIRKGYLKKGYYQVDVQPIRKIRKDGRVDLTMKIIEGEITRIKRIRFIGNHTFSSVELADVIASGTGGIATWFRDKDIFDRKRLDADKQMILQHYLNTGYLDAKVESTLLSLSPDKRWFYVTFSIREGPQYQIASLNLQGDLIPDRETLTDLLEVKSGDIYSLKKMSASIDAITVRVGDEGYAFATVTPLFQRHPESKKVDIIFDVEKGHEVYVERIEISGNMKTEDQVIRREIRQMEASRFSSSKLELSKKRMQKLGYFSDVRVSMPRGSSPDKVNLKVGVEEKSTGSWTLGVGFSQLEKVFIRSSINQANFLGKGLSTNLSGDIGAKTQNINASISDPYFMGENMSASLSVFKRQSRFQSVTSYKENSFGGGVGLGIPITENTTYNLGYRYSRNNIFDVPLGSSPFLLSQEGVKTTGEFTQGLTWDTRNNFISATSGSLLSGGFSVAGLGGNSRFVTASGKTASYLELADGIIFNPSAEVRYIHGYNGRPVQVSRRLSLGGIGSVRGFDASGISIRDPLNNDLIGGNKSAFVNMNLFFPLPYMRTSGFRGVSFVDMGDVADFNQSLSFARARISTGFGIEWISPIGPIGLSWAFVLRDRSTDVRK